MGIETKRVFLIRVIAECKFKDAESRGALVAVVKDSEILQRVHFVEHANHCPNGLVIKLSGIDGPPLEYFNGAYVTTDVMNFLAIMKVNKKKKLYIEIVMDRFTEGFMRYRKVLEENPYTPKAGSEEGPETENIDIPFTTKLQKDLEYSRVMDQIDVALDNNDAVLFAELSKELTLLNEGKAHAYEGDVSSGR